MRPGDLQECNQLHEESNTALCASMYDEHHVECILPSDDFLDQLFLGNPADSEAGTASATASYMQSSVQAREATNALQAPNHSTDANIISSAAEADSYRGQ